MAAGLSRRHLMTSALLAAGAPFALAACAPSDQGASPSSGGGERPKELTVQFVGPPVSLNPALGSAGRSATYLALAYDPLIYLAGDGTLVPDLATKWGFVGEGNTVFELTLRDGVTFHDGAPMDATAVVNSIKYFLGSGGGQRNYAGPVATVEAPDASTVRITYSSPYPFAPTSLTQFYGMGQIIGPDGLADPEKLLTSSDGTGQYTYDASGSVTNSSYRYVKNPTYFNPSAQLYDAMTVKIISDPGAVLSAIRTGQVVLADGNRDTVDQAKAAGLEIQEPMFFTWTLILADRGGAVCKPLADPRVRQAIGYAFDRAAMAKALGGDHLVPNGQINLPGTSGYVEGGGFTTDLAKAKQLLKDAGYADGFEMPIVAETVLDANATLAQAVSSALGELGIKAPLKVVSTGIGQFSQEATTKKYPAVFFPVAGTDTDAVSQQIMAPTGGLFDPWADVDPQAQALLRQAATTDDPAQRTALHEKASARLIDIGWVVPLFTQKSLIYISKAITNVKTSTVNPNPIPVGPAKEYAWQPAGG
jgi:peptide/nickel transport system substrate-binding protein